MAQYRCLRKKRPHDHIAVYNDMHSDPQNTHQNIYRYIPLYRNVGVFYADNGIDKRHENSRTKRAAFDKTRVLLNQV